MAEQYILKNKHCVVTIEEIPPDRWNADAYNKMYNPANYKRNDFTKAFSVHIDLCGREITLAIIGSHLSFIDDCALLEDDVLTVMMNEQFFKINILDGTVINYKTLDIFASNFAIFKIDQGYVVYGEIDILFLDENFEKKASFSGRDIFVSISGKNPFTLTKNTVQLYDFEDNFYEVDFNGNVIREEQAQ